MEDPDHTNEIFAENDQNDLNDPYAQNDPYGSFENSGNFRSAHDQSPEIYASEYDRLLEKSKNSEPDLEKFEYQKFSSRRSSSSSVDSFESKTFDQSDTTSSEILPCSNSQLTNDFQKSAEAKSIGNHAEKLIEARVTLFLIFIHQLMIKDNRKRNVIKNLNIPFKLFTICRKKVSAATSRLSQTKSKNVT